MKFPAFFRRRSLVLPTLLGWLLILAALVLVVGMLFRNMAVFLTVNEPVGADYLVIEAWMDKEELDQGLEYFEDNDFKKILLVGGPISNDFYGTEISYPERAADYLQTQDLAQDMIAIVNSPYSAQNRTFLNAVMAREWFKQEGISLSRLDVFSSGVHTRRSRDLYQQAFGDQVAIGIVAAQPLNFDPAHWWSANGTGKGVAVEFASWVLTKCCFHPREPGSHLEKWGIEKTATGGD
jgi:hypothetical protein